VIDLESRSRKYQQQVEKSADKRFIGGHVTISCRPHGDRLVIQMAVDFTRILRFTGSVANDLCGSVTIFWASLFRVFPTENTINKAHCNTVEANI
jgi:hypothetical protein